VGPKAQKLNMSALSLVFDARGEAKLVAETAHTSDVVATATHIIFPCTILFADHLPFIFFDIYALSIADHFRPARLHLIILYYPVLFE